VETPTSQSRHHVISKQSESAVTKTLWKKILTQKKKKMKKSDHKIFEFGLGKQINLIIG